ncbi:U2 snRNP-associated SURP domain-containing protein, partial [Perkinsus olseni]
TFINSLLCFMGSGVLGLPHAFNEIGLLGGIIILSLVALLALHCMLLLVHCQTYLRDTRSKHAVTYGDVGYYAFGRIGSMLVDICIILTQTGFAVAYLIFISHNVSDMIDDYYYPDDEKDTTVSTRGFILAVILPPLVILSWLRYLKMLAPFSLLAEIAILFALFAVFAYDIQSIITKAWSPVLSITTTTTSSASSSSQFEDDPSGGSSSFISTASNVSLWLNLSRLPYFFGISVYCYEGVGMHAEPIIIQPYMVILGDTCYNNVSLCVGLYFTYPLMLFPVYELIDAFFDSTL